MLGIYNSSTTLGLIFGTALGGLLFAIGPHHPYLLAGSVLMFTVLPALALQRRLRPRPALAAADGQNLTFEV